MGARPVYRMTLPGADALPPRRRMLERCCIGATGYRSHGLNKPGGETPPKNRGGVPESLWKPHKSKELAILHLS